MAVGEERDLSTAYRNTKRAPEPQGQGLNDPYVRFFRMAERRIAEMTGKGVVCFISNYSWLDGPSFTGMREQYLEAFDCVWIDCLNGDKYKTGKLTPWGDPDPSVFSTKQSPVGIQVGTAISLFVRREDHEEPDAVRFRHLWGVTKRQQLLETAEQDGVSLYEPVEPSPELGLPFIPGQIAAGYLSWPTVPDLFPMSYPGIKTSRDDLLVDVDRRALLERMQLYFDPEVSDDEMGRIAPCAMQRTKRFDAVKVRTYLRDRGLLPKNIVPYAYRPFDSRWLYWEPDTKLLDEKRSDYFPQVFDGNMFLVTTGRTRKGVIEPSVSLSLHADLNYMDSGARAFPLYYRLLDGGPAATSLNVSELLTSYASGLGREIPDTFYHCLAITHSAAYQVENGYAICYDWPRIPLPADRERLEASAALGRRAASLLDVETDVPGVTSERIRPELKQIAVVSHAEGRALDPDQSDLDVTCGWGHAGARGVTMPGKGRAVEREFQPGEIDNNLRPLLGETNLDIYLNDVAFWKNVPKRVWTYTIGGYQVVKKWLSYRERDLLGRGLTPDEAHHVTEMIRRIAAILLLEPELDANYEAVKADTYEWRRAEE